MTSLTDRIVDLARRSLEDPRAAARHLLALDVPLPARTAGLLLMAVASALLMQLGFILLPPADDPVSRFMTESPLRSAAIQWLILAASVLLIQRVGQAWGGVGNLADTLLVVVWLQVIMLSVQLVQLLALLVAPPLAGLVNLAGMVLFFWLLCSFIAELHGFTSRLKVFFGVLFVSFAVALVIVMLLSLVLGPEALQNV